MQGVELPLLVKQQERHHILPAKVNLYVDLVDPSKKGIHMSRLYSIVQKELPVRELSISLIEDVLRKNLISQEGISKLAALKIQFDWLTQRPSLRSGLRGWRRYPVTIHSELSGDRVTHVYEVTVTYSSTCPCSASLARQLIQSKFEEDFRDQKELKASSISEWLGQAESINATPHSQRSTAHIKVELTSGNPLLPFDLIEKAEKSLSTPVQAMVKREDEQEFARLNGQNLMFCEDAARRLKLMLEGEDYLDFRCEVRHMESLHPHDAVAITTKGLPGGFRA